MWGDISVLNAELLNQNVVYLNTLSQFPYPGCTFLLNQTVSRLSLFWVLGPSRSFFHLFGVSRCTQEYLTYDGGHYYGGSKPGSAQGETLDHSQVAGGPSHTWPKRKPVWAGFEIRAISLVRNPSNPSCLSLLPRAQLSVVTIFIDRLLKCLPEQRLSCEQALEQPFFSVLLGEWLHFLFGSASARVGFYPHLNRNVKKHIHTIR